VTALRSRIYRPECDVSTGLPDLPCQARAGPVLSQLAGQARLVRGGGTALFPGRQRRELLAVLADVEPAPPARIEVRFPAAHLAVARGSGQSVRRVSSCSLNHATGTGGNMDGVHR
jgi:hypothetical protein